MSEFPLGSFEFEDRIMAAKVQEARREARSRRLQQQAGAGEARSDRFYSATLVRLGQRLSAWGAQLEAHYSREGSTAKPLRSG
jgi:hypothetical protein